MARGKYELELETAANSAADWQLDGLPALLEALGTLESTMKTIASDLGISGSSGDAAQQQFLAMKTNFQTLITNLESIQKAIDHENTSRRSFAEAALKALPSTAIDPWVFVAAAGTAAFTFPGIAAPVAAATAIGEIQTHLDAQRESEAQGWVASMTDAYNAATIPAVANIKGNDKGDDPGSKSYTGTGGTGALDNVKWPSAKTSPTDGTGGGKTGGNGLVGDGPNVGSFPPVSGGPTSGGGPGSTWGPDPLPPTGIGVGAGAAGIAALGAARLGSSASGFGGLAGAGSSSATSGSGGLLGSSGKAASAAAAAEESEEVAGAKPGTSMMGAPGGAGGRDKEKRSGLGGFIAPKLEDDEEQGPRSASALAGSRDDSND